MRGLDERGVRVVVVGAFAAQLRGVPGIVTRDLDLTPALDEENLQRLADLLHELSATVRVEPHALGPVELPADGGLIARAPILNLHLPGVGDVDVIHRAAAANETRGALDYSLLAGNATPMAVAGETSRLLVMSERDWLDAKLSPPVREKDAVHVALYRRWLEERG